MRMYPELNKGWIVMINNRGAQGLIEEIERSIAGAYDIPEYRPIEKKSLEWNASLYPQDVGIYKDQTGQTQPAHTTITMHDNKLFLLDSYLPPQKIQLFQEGNNTFFAKELILSVEEDYKVSALKFVSFKNQSNALILLDNDGKSLLDENSKKEMILRKQ